jgi:hypothetical protein
MRYAWQASLLSFLLCLPLAAQSVTKITVDGRGMSLSEALEDAKRNAIEQGLGVFLDSEVLVENATLIEDQIYTKANGFIKKYETVRRGTEEGGIIVVTIEAEVTEILDEIIKDQIAVDLLLRFVRQPRFMVFLHEDIGGQQETTYAETEIGRLMGERGFDIVSRQQTSALQQRSTELALLTEQDVNKAIAIAAEFGAEIIVTGRADVNLLTGATLGNRKSGQANLTAQVIRTDNAQILAQNTFHGKRTHIEAETAGMLAIKDAAQQLANYLMRETIHRWSKEQAGARAVSLRINGVKYAQRSKIEKHIKAQRGVQSVDRRSFTSGVAVLAVQYEGMIEDLGGVLDGHEFGGFSLEIIGDSPNGFELSVVAP